MATYASIKYDMDLSSNATGAGSLTLLSTQTASSSATISFTSGIDSTYKEYIFKFIDIHGANNGAQFQVGFRDGSTDYDATKTSTFFESENNEADNSASQSYETGGDLAQGTGFQNLTQDLGNDNDQSLCGELHLFDPSNTTFVKHFSAVTSSYASDDRILHSFINGYCNVTAAIDAVQFKMSSGNCDAGTIKMYGVA